MIKEWMDETYIVNEGTIKLEYYLLCEERETGYPYGVEIVLHDEEGLCEIASKPNVFYDKKEAQQAIRLLCEGSVTPLTLTDVLLDMVDARDFVGFTHTDYFPA